MDEIKYSCKLGILSRPDGSAIFCQGKGIKKDKQVLLLIFRGYNGYGWCIWSRGGKDAKSFN